MNTDVRTRNLSLGEIFVLAKQIYLSNMSFIIAACLVVYVPVYTIIELLPRPALDGTIPAIGDAINQLSIILGITLMFTPLIVAAMTYVAKQSLDGQPVTYAGMMDVSLIKWGKHIVTGLMFSAVIFIASFLIIPAFYFGVAFNFYTGIIAVTDKWGIAALSESRRIVKGNWWRTFGFLLLIVVFIMSLNSGINTIIAAIVPATASVQNVVINVFVNTVYAYFQLAVAVWLVNKLYVKGGFNDERL